MPVSLLVGIVLAGAVVAPYIVRVAPRASGRILALVPAAVFLTLLGRLPLVAGGAAVVERLPWLPSLGVSLSFRVDGLSLLFALLVSGLGAVITLYAGRYLAAHRDLGRFYLALFLFMGAMLGLVLADDLLVLFVFWELTSISSFLLIGFEHERDDARKAALQALLVTGGGGLALLAGLLLLGGAAETFSLSEILASGNAVRGHGAYPAILALVLLGAFTKSAQFPFHFWLPNAMAAPTPVSAYLHSATMVKAGIYLLARLDSTLGDTSAWTWSLSLAGGLTMLLGAIVALRQTDLKRILAYTTLTALGTLTLLLGLSFEDAVKAAVVFLIVHSLYKGALFLVAGIVDHETGTRDVLALGGLRRALPVTTAAAMVAGLSMAGLPPLFGFIAKELTYKAKLGFEASTYLLPAVAVLANALTVTAAGILVVRTFFGPRRDTPRAPHEAPRDMWVGPVVLAGVGLAFGVAPALVSDSLEGPAVFAVLGRPMTITLTLWYGPNFALLLSAVTVALGVGAFLRWDDVRSLLSRFDGIRRVGAEAAYERIMAGLIRVADMQTRLLQTGDLRHYLTWTVAVLVTVGGVAMARAGGVPSAVPEVGYVPWVLALAVVVGGWGVVLARTRLTALMALGVAGTGVALFFVMLGAPDLALTQFLIETLTLILAVLVIARLPRFETGRQPRGRRFLHGMIAVAAGLLMSGLTVAVTSEPFDPAISDFYARTSMPEGFGRNIVNVILVDFRALDTLGEITVLAVAALGATALMQFPRAEQPDRPGYDSLVLQTAARLAVPLLLLLAGFLLLRGHNAPGGGFIAGLVASGAIVLSVLAWGTASTRRLLPVAPEGLLLLGLVVALASGLLAALASAPLLTGLWASIDLPAGLGPLKLGTPLLFDIGVFLLVLGFAVSVIVTKERA
jgi:multicomponent Na+:H+ antiporter subunit A